MTMTDRNTPEYQRNVSRFVHMNVHACVSHLISHFAQTPEALGNSEYCIDDLMTICSDFRCRECNGEGIEGWFIELECEKCDHEWRLDADNDTELDEGEEFRCPECGHEQFTASSVETDECCYCDDGHADDPVEALEHWIVDGWLAARLDEKGEMVTTDFMGLTIWGRTTSGQSISLDGVICDIYDELHARHDKPEPEPEPKADNRKGLPQTFDPGSVPPSNISGRH